MLAAAPTHFNSKYGMAGQTGSGLSKNNSCAPLGADPDSDPIMQLVRGWLGGGRVP